MKKRMIERYDALKDAAERWPGWRLRRVSLGRREKLIVPDDQLILINENVDPEFGAAQAVAHLDLEHHAFDGDVLPTEEQSRAEWLAKVRLDDENTRSSVSRPDDERATG